MNLSLLLSALILVESNNNSQAIGDHGQAVGILQIHPEMVEECNRIATLKHLPFHWSLADRRSAEQSKRMFYVYEAYWLPKTKHLSNETAARIWNGGPKGYLKDATTPYWEKILLVCPQLK